MKLIGKEGDNLNPEKITVELDRADGELFAEALDHAGHGLQRVIDARRERGETGEQEGLPTDPNDYGRLAADIALWFGIDYTHAVHFLDDAIRSEEEAGRDFYIQQLSERKA